MSKTNTGAQNTGDYNSGHYNSGDHNTGNFNAGNRNSGHQNTGYCNTGNRNSGHYNSGDYNSGNCNSGFFCTETPSPLFFDKPTSLSWEEACNLIPYIKLSSSLPLQEAFPIAWAQLSDAEKQRWLDLPNFDAQKFLQCTGVDVRPQLPYEIEVDGVRYRRVS